MTGLQPQLMTPLDEIKKDIPGAVWKLQMENKELKIRVEGLEKQIQIIGELLGKLDELMNINANIASTNAQYETLKNLRKILFGGKK